jgi:hypothetical protein
LLPASASTGDWDCDVVNIEKEVPVNITEDTDKGDLLELQELQQAVEESPLSSSAVVAVPNSRLDENSLRSCSEADKSFVASKNFVVPFKQTDMRGSIAKDDEATCTSIILILPHTERGRDRQLFSCFKSSRTKSIVRVVLYNSMTIRIGNESNCKLEIAVDL